ncbi:MAG: hypothetical protein AABW47_02525 [Nanoarchaeota archaeon]
MAKKDYPPEEQYARELEKEVSNMAERSRYSPKGPTQLGVARKYEVLADAWGVAGDEDKAGKFYDLAKKWGGKEYNRILKINDKRKKLKNSRSKENPSIFSSLRKSLESKFSAVISIFTLLVSLFFVTSTITGNVVAGLDENASRIIGICFFACGLIFAFVYFKNKNKKSF